MVLPVTAGARPKNKHMNVLYGIFIYFGDALKIRKGSFRYSCTGLVPISPPQMRGHKLKDQKVMVNYKTVGVGVFIVVIYI